MRTIHKPKALVRVHWLDSRGGGTWVWFSNFKSEVAKCVSVGFVVEHTKELITLAAHVHDFEKEDWAFDGYMTIPLFAVTKIEKL
jgi:hypothetical protein